MRSPPAPARAHCPRRSFGTPPTLISTCESIAVPLALARGRFHLYHAPAERGVPLPKLPRFQKAAFGDAESLTAARAEHERQLYELRKANQKIKEDAPVVPIINDWAPLMLSAKVRGFVQAPEEWYDMTTVWLA